MNSKFLLPLITSANAEPLNDFVLKTLKSADWSSVLTSKQPEGNWLPSKVYKSPDLIAAVKKMTEQGVGDDKLIGGSTQEDAKVALVNIAAFLAQSMQETIQYDSCDENNWDSNSALSSANACGQLGQSYQDYKCPAGQEKYQCEVDPNMEAVATTTAKYWGAPGPLFCAPKSKVPKAPKWVGTPTCTNPDTRTPFTGDDFFKFVNGKMHDQDCNSATGTHNAYPGQKGGGFEFCAGGACPNTAAPQFGQEARTDVEGCCWWGRGVIQTTGVCNFGKLNYFAGARAKREGRSSLYPSVDFCKDPSAVCASTEYPDLKWTAGLFYWVQNLQDYPTDDKYHYNYKQELKDFTKAGNINDASFINKVSGIVNRGCPATSCPKGPVDQAAKRAANFKTVLKALGFPWASNQNLRKN